ncbi:hypothetical protein P154DRAFT_616814 [Amniculicola lignicola CBS 123094]|uniref:ferric-chelate reductase (NADPH) n=1 Tax=Amniculicola lignicola CBS 123094 TaxID=1392246 RepID=A0A6A5WS02_9PLEO|nr:hypothetical protein P154DRAFT_616814 [Amniculicola lignicola CBS 123094]
MDMSMPDPTVVDLPITDPKCVQAVEACTAFYAAENASQAAIPWAGQFKYGHWATYYWVIIIGLLSIYHVFTTITDHRSPSARTAGNGPGILQKVQAAGRSIFYRRLPPNGIAKLLDASPNYGVLAFLLLTLVFLLGLTFAQRPYYRDHLGYGSPPIAIRTGLMATACVPILVALAGKANIITLFTGISHERLNVVHRWVAWMSLGLSFIHALPYFIASYQDFGNGGYQRVVKEFYAGGFKGCNQATGVPPLAILFGLCILSLPAIRHRFYESFYASHIVLAITYLGLLFWHSMDTLDSWAYLWATLAIWAASWLTRIFVKTQPLKFTHEWFAGSPATLTILDGHVTRIDVWPERDFKWTPGQHAFLRFTDFAPLDNHPFTIASAAPTSAAKEQPHAVFLARSHSGFTNKLTSYVHSRSEAKTDSTSTTVWIDGPYGGTRPPPSRFDSLVLVAGGTGISACLPRALDFVARATSPNASMKLKRVVMVWAVKKKSALSWICEELKTLLAASAGRRRDEGVDEKATPPGELDLVIRVHVTGEEGNEKAPSKSEKAGLSSSSQTSPPVVDTTHGRPSMSALLAEFVRPAERTMVVGCGPEGFRYDVANAVAGSQTRVLKGECIEIALHLEVFGW